MNLIPGTIVDGRYLIESLLGTGGMAEVYLARHLTLGSRHAIKLLGTHSPEVRKRLLAEGQVQAALRHENVVTVTDAIDVGRAPALVMEYVRGPHLGWLLGQMSFSVDQADDLARQLFSGIGAAHELGIVHRDLKPANLLLDVSRARPVLKIADFGLVKVLQTDDRDKTRSGSTFGTPEYMSPEQVRDASRVDPRSDLFSVGSILYEIVTGRRCFLDTEDMYDLFNRIVESRYAPVEGIAPAAPPRMIAAIRAALDPSRDTRCQTASALSRLWFADAPFIDRDAWSDPVYVQQVALWLTPRDTPPAPTSGSELIGNAPLPPAPPAPPSPVPLPPVADPVPVAPAPARRVPWSASVAAALAFAALLGVGAIVSTVIFGPAAVTPPAAEVPVPSPGPVAAPSSVAAAVVPAPLPPEPVPSPAVAVPVRPRPGAPAPPESTPSPVPVAAPVTAPVPPPAPAPIASVQPTFQVIGADGITLSLREVATGRAVPLAGAAPGRYTLVAFFEPRVPTDVATLEVGPGSAWTVRCSMTAHKCTAKAD